MSDWDHILDQPSTFWRTTLHVCLVCLAAPGLSNLAALIAATARGVDTPGTIQAIIALVLGPVVSAPIVAPVTLPVLALTLFLYRRVFWLRARPRRAVATARCGFIGIWWACFVFGNAWAVSSIPWVYETYERLSSPADPWIIYAGATVFAVLYDAVLSSTWSRRPRLTPSEPTPEPQPGPPAPDPTAC